VNGFKFARASLKLDQRVEVAANFDDANAITVPEEITTSRYIPLDEQYTEPFIQRRTFKLFRRKPNVQHYAKTPNAVSLFNYARLFLIPLGRFEHGHADGTTEHSHSSFR
jgi:hypothetical protein